MRSSFSFRVGGVQEFIDSARTTADFWVSSYLISHLVATAAKVVAQWPEKEFISQMKCLRLPRWLDRSRHFQMVFWLWSPETHPCLGDRSSARFTRNGTAFTKRSGTKC